MRLKTFLAVTFTTVAAAIGAAPASAAFGDLTFANCIEESTTPQDLCTANFALLGVPQDVTIGPDGTSAYSVSFQNDRVTEYDRNPITGALTYVTCFSDPPATCPNPVPGLGGVQNLAITADGTSLYASSQNDDAIVEFARNTSTGALEYTVNGSCYDDEDTNLEASCTNVKALDSAQGIAVSADGQSVYVASVDNDAIAHFDRNASGTEPMNGNLNQDIDNPCITDPGAQEDGCDATTTNLATPLDIVISADHEALYMSDRDLDTIAIFDRDTPPDPDPGDISDDGARSGDPGLAGVSSLAMGPEGDSLYAIGEHDEALVRYERLAGNALDPQFCFEDNDFGVDLMDCEDVDGLAGANDMGAIGPNAIAIPPDGRSLYLATGSDSAIARFSRDPADGSLNYLGCIDDAVDGPDTCADSLGVLSGVSGVVSAGNGMLYASAPLDQVIGTFSRELDPVPPGPGPVTPTPVTPGTPVLTTPVTARKKCKKGRKLKKGKCVKKKKKK